tara:strand:+ start:194 stop:505 length:312 start_codon:yes stop_codon:yes gene_type:complete
MAFDFSKVEGTNGKGQSNEALLLDYFKTRGEIPFYSHDIQLNAVLYFKNIWKRSVQPDTLSRLWRSMRESYKTDKYNSSLFKHGMKVVELEDPKYKKWQIIHG